MIRRSPDRAGIARGVQPVHVSRLFPTRTVALSQVASRATAVFATFPRATVLLSIVTFRDLPTKIALSGLMP